MWEEESERGGYLPLDDAAMNAVASMKNVSWKQNVKAEPSSAAVTKLPSFWTSTFTRTIEASLGNLNQATSSVRLVGERYEDMKPGPSTSRDGGEFVPIVLGNMTNESSSQTTQNILKLPKFSVSNVIGSHKDTDLRFIL